MAQTVQGRRRKSAPSDQRELSPAGPDVDHGAEGLPKRDAIVFDCGRHAVPQAPPVGLTREELKELEQLAGLTPGPRHLHEPRPGTSTANRLQVNSGRGSRPGH